MNPPPASAFSFPLSSSSFLTRVGLSKQLHSHHGKDEDDDAEYKGEISQGSHRLAHDGNEKVQRRPRLGQLEDAKLKEEEQWWDEG